MQRFQVEIHGPEAEKDALALQDALAPVARTQVVTPPTSKGIDAVAVITVSAAVLQSVDILYRFYRDWRERRRHAPASRSAIVIVLGDGTRINLAESDAEQVKARLGARNP